MNYEKPEIRDYGELLDLTDAIVVGCFEDGGDKATIFNNQSCP